MEEELAKINLTEQIPLPLEQLADLNTILTIEKALKIVKLDTGMKRKVIKQGHNTLTVTLPTDWVRRLNIQPGAEIDMSELNNGLFLSTEKKSGERKIEIDITGLDIPTIWKYFTAVYREGYDEVTVKFNPHEILESSQKYLMQHKHDAKYGKLALKGQVSSTLQTIINRFIGFEIVEHGKDFIKIKEMGETTSKEFDNALRRLFFLMEQMAEETLNAIKGKNPKISSSMHDVDVTLDKFHDYCIRILNKMGNKDQKKTSLLFAIMFNMELAGDEFKNVSHHLIKRPEKSKAIKNLEKLAELVKAQVDLFKELFYKFSKEKLKDLAKLDQQIYLDVASYYEGATEEEKEIIHHLRMIERYIYSMTELRLEMEF